MGDLIGSHESLTLSPRTCELLRTERQFTAGGFEPMPVFFARGQGSTLWVSERTPREPDYFWFRC